MQSTNNNIFWIFVTVNLLLFYSGMNCSSSTALQIHTRQEYRQYRKQFNMVEEASPMVEEFECSTMQINQRIIHDRQPFQIDTCYQYHSCDNPQIRDATSLNETIVFLLQVILFNDNSSEFVRLNQTIPLLIYELNCNFKPVGIYFEYQIIYATPNGDPNFYVAPNCPSEGITSTCYDSEVVVEQILGSKWQTPGTLQIVVAKILDGSHGYSYLPWTSLHGLTVLDPRVVRVEYTTITHEIAHSLSLHHVFRGVSEITDCLDPCAEKEASDTSGDFCSDTPPVVVNFLCGSYPDGEEACGRTIWSNELPMWQNFMSYNVDQSCRNQFTPQQIKRMRCYAFTMSSNIIPANSTNSTYVECDIRTEIAPADQKSLASTALISSTLIAIAVLVTF